MLLFNMKVEKKQNPTTSYALYLEPNTPRERQFLRLLKKKFGPKAWQEFFLSDRELAEIYASALTNLLKIETPRQVIKRDQSKII